MAHATPSGKTRPPLPAKPPKAPPHRPFVSPSPAGKHSPVSRTAPGFPGLQSSPPGGKLRRIAAPGHSPRIFLISMKPQLLFAALVGISAVHAEPAPAPKSVRSGPIEVNAIAAKVNG